MKTIVSIMLMVFWMGTMHAQVISLDPATVKYSPKVKVTTNLGELDFEIKEAYTNHFVSNPIRFIQENFDFKALDIKGEDEVEVSFLSRKGYLIATYDAKGDLVRTSQRFKDIKLPLAVWRDIYSQNVGWKMVSNLYTANGMENRIHKEMYKVKLMNGKQTKNIRLIPETVSGGRVASTISLD